MKACIYPGSFDPFTNGHLDILRRSAQIFENVVVAVLNNSAKQSFFSLEERIRHVETVLREYGIANARVESFGGLLVDFAKSHGALAIIRGLRAVTDFEYELQLASANRALAPDIETLFLMASPQYSFLSSSIVREAGSLGGDIKDFIPAVNHKSVVERLLKK